MSLINCLAVLIFMMCYLDVYAHDDINYSNNKVCYAQTVLEAVARTKRYTVSYKEEEEESYKVKALRRQYIK